MDKNKFIKDYEDFWEGNPSQKKLEDDLNEVAEKIIKLKHSATPNKMSHHIYFRLSTLK